MEGVRFLTFTCQHGHLQRIDDSRLYARTPQTVGCCADAKVLSAKIRGAGSTSNFAYVAPCEDHEGLYNVYTLLNQVCHKLDVLRFGLGGPQHSSSRVKAPRRTRSYHSLNQLLLVRSSAASETG